jgi:ABC-type transporter Mla MlaB component
MPAATCRISGFARRDRFGRGWLELRVSAIVPTRVLIEVLKTFDESVAQAVRAALVRGVSSVTIDFAQATRVDAVSLAALARVLAHDREGAAVVEGLSAEQELLLRYLGTHVARLSMTGPIATA